MAMYQILFVEDDEDILFLVSRYKLWRQGEYRIAGTAANGKEALDKLAAFHYDLIITDIRMPVMDGLELCRRIREQGYQTLIILASTYSDFAYAREGIRLGAVEYIEKPYSEEKLEEAFRLAGQFLSGNGMQEEFYEALISEEESEEILTDRLLRRVREKYPDNQLMVRQEVGSVLKGIWTKMTEQAPWLEIMEPVDIFIGKDLSEDVCRILHEYTCMIRSYGIKEPDKIVRNIAAILKQNLSRPHIQDYLAEQLELSKDYMGKRFRNAVGIPISEYCTRLKMEQAKSMLTGTNKKVYEISVELGYSTVDYFTGLFKSYTGITPTGYRGSGKKRNHMV